MTSPDTDRIFGSVFDNAPIGMAVLDPNGVIRLCNAAVCRLLGRPAEDLVGDTFFPMTHPDDLDGARHNCGLMQRDGARIVRHECRFLRPDGSSVWASVSTSRVPATDGYPAHLVMHIEDIDDRKALEAELRHRALHDPLTGLGNRALLVERIRQAADRPFCVYYVDLDGFKSVNDRFGHRAGDDVLCELAHRIRTLVGERDTAARLGGDEFVILRLDVHTGPRGGALGFAGRLERAAARPFQIGDREIALTAAIGIGSSGQACTPEEIIDLADRHMYRAKTARRG